MAKKKDVEQKFIDLLFDMNGAFGSTTYSFSTKRDFNYYLGIPLPKRGRDQRMLYKLEITGLSHAHFYELRVSFSSHSREQVFKEGLGFLEAVCAL